MKPYDSDNSGLRIVYLSHGGGPLPVLGDASHRAMVAFMRQLPGRIRKPDAIVVVSAHWEESTAAVLGAPNPAMLYDYYGFPGEAYRITYPAPGHPDLAERMVGLLTAAGISAHIEPRRGFDHGLFIPLALMYPQADIPSLQLSLVRGLDPAAHIALGKALQAMATENVLVIGSGFSFHNMPAFFWKEENRPDPANDAFQDWLIEAICAESLSRDEREQRLIEWQNAPSARYCHPREEHLLPLHVCLGMAGTPGQVLFDDYILGKRAVAFGW